MAAESVGQIGLDLVVNQNGFNKQMHGIKGLAKKAATALATAFAVKKIVDFGKSAIQLGSDLNEVQNVVDVTFSSMSANVDKFAKDAITNFGLSETMAKRFTGTFGAMAKAFGFSEKAAYDMSTTLTGLAGDVASFYNISQDEAYTKLKSVFTGETETLKDLGIVMTQNALDAYAMANGYGKVTAKMSEAEKVALRYAFVQKQLTLASGDFARTSDSWANQVRVLKLQFDSLKATIGQGLINLFTPIIQHINILLGKLQVLANGFKVITEIITGKKLQGASGAIASIGDSAANTAGSVAGIGKAAEASAKKIKKSLAGFDQVNLLTDNSDSSGGSGGGSGSEIPAIDGAGYLNEINKGVDESNAKLIEMANKIKDFIDGIKEAAEPTVDALKRLNEKLAPFKTFVAKGLESFVTDVLVPIGRWTLGEGLPRLLDCIGKLFEDIDWPNLTDAIKKFNQAIAPFAIKVGEGLIAFIEVLVESLSPIVAGLVEGLANALSFLADAINSIPDDVAIALGGAIGGMVTAILLFKGASKISEIIIGIKDAMTSFIDGVKADPLLLVAAAIGAVVGALTAYNKTKFDSSELGQYLTRVDELVRSSQQFNDETQRMLDNHEQRRSDIETEYGAIEILSDKYFDLADQESLTNEQQELLKTYSQELIKKVPELSGLIDEQTGAYKGTKKEIQACIDKSKEYYLVQAAQESLVEIAKAQYDAEKNLKTLAEERETASKNLKTAEDKYHDAMKTGYQKDILTYRGEVEKCKGALEDIDTQIGETKDAQSDLSDEWDYATDYITKYSDTTKDEIGQISEAVKTESANASHNATAMGKTIVDDTSKSINNNSGTTKTTVKSWTDKINTWFEENAGTKAFTGHGKDATTAFNDSIKDNRDNTQGFINTWATKINTWFKDKTSSFPDNAKYVVDGFNNSIRNNQTTSQDFIQTWAGKINQWFKDKLDIHSPSRVSYSWGEFVILGFNNAIKKLGATSKKVVSNWVDSFSNVNASVGLELDTATPEIPAFATGTYVKANTPRLAMIGDNKHEGEYVAPESKLRQMALDVASAMSGRGLDEGTLYRVMSKVFKEYMHFYIGDEDLARHANRGNEMLDLRLYPVKGGY